MRLRIRNPLGVLAVACAVVTVMTVTGCGTAPAPTAPAPTVVATRGSAVVEPATDPRPFGTADTAFGLDVLRAWCAQYPGRNLVFSPSTLASALGMAYLGAHGATAAAMARVLHLPAGGGTPLAAGLQARSRALSGLDGPGVTLASSDRVWADPSLPPLASYLNAVATGYGASLGRAPFLSDPARAAAEINHDIAVVTRGHISHMITPDMLSQVGWVLTSALYLDAKWAVPFNPNATSPGRFTLADGKTVTASYLDGDGFKYVKASGWTAVGLPYKGGKLTMTALLPPAGSAPCALPSQASLAKIAASLRAAGAGRLAGVSLPKVSLRTSGSVGDMRQVLQRLGMGVAFTGAADFTGLSKQAGSLAFVQQAATLKVAEKGTIGAAATGVGVATAGVPVTISFDRPYLMLVSAGATGEPLFLAEVANPATS